MFVPFLVGSTICAGLIAIVSFILYGRARMQEQIEKEKLYLRIHYSSLFLLLIMKQITKK